MKLKRRTPMASFSIKLNILITFVKAVMFLFRKYFFVVFTSFKIGINEIIKRKTQFATDQILLLNNELQNKKREKSLIKVTFPLK